jgi:hypothetical protein
MRKKDQGFIIVAGGTGDTFISSPPDRKTSTKLFVLIEQLSNQTELRSRRKYGEATLGLGVGTATEKGTFKL